MLLVLILFAAKLFMAAPQSEFFNLRGTVQLPHGGTPSGPVTVRLVGLNDEPVGNASTGALGIFEFHGIRRGSYYILVEGPNLQEVRQPVEVPAFRYVTVYAQPATVRFKQNFDDHLGSDHTVDAGQLRAEIPGKAIREYEKGLSEMRKGDLEEAMERLKRAVEIAPDYYNAHNMLGSIYDRAGRYAEAKRQFIRALELNSSASEPLTSLGGIYIREEEWDEAIEALNRAVRAVPASAVAEYYLGSALFKTGEYEEAEQHLLRARVLQENFSPPGLMLINVYLRQERLKDALDEVDRYIQQNPEADKLKELHSLKRRLLKELAKQK